MQKKRMTGTERYKKVIRQRRIFVLCVFVLLLLLCICLFTPLFGITEISVSGNTILSQEEIIAASGIERGENVFRINKKKVDKSLKELAYIEDSDVKRKFPARVVIAVKEAKQDLIFDTPTEFVVSTISGRVLEKSEDVSALTAPIVYGINVTKAENAGQLEADDAENLQMNLERIGCFYPTSFWGDIDEFYVTDISNFMLVMKSGMKVTFGTIDSTEGLMRKIKMMEQILPQVKQTSRSYLDLTTDKGYFGEYTQDELDEMKRREERGESLLDQPEEDVENDSADTSSEEKEESKKSAEPTKKTSEEDSRKKASASKSPDAEEKKSEKSTKPKEEQKASASPSAKSKSDKTASSAEEA